MKPTSPTVRAVRLATFSGLACTAAMANGIRISSQDGLASSRGEAFAATADNPSAIYYNPAGIAQLKGHDLRGGVYGLHLNVEYTAPAGGSTIKNQEEWHAIPQLFYTYGPEELPVTFGLGLYSPYGLSSEWAQDSGFRMLAIKGELTYMTLNPTVAFKLREGLFFGVGLTINDAELNLQRGLTPIPNNDLFKFKGDGLALGANLGLLWQPCEQVSFGVNYRSPTEIDFDGTTTTAVYNAVPGVFPAPFSLEQDANTSMPFPQNVAVGVSYRPTPDWNFEFNADWTDWNTMNALNVNQASTGTVQQELYWESSWYYEFGVTRRLGEHWRISGGYIYNQNSVPTAFYTPLVSDLNRQFVSIGGGYTSKHFNFDLAYQYGFSPGRDVSGSWAIAGAMQTADGTYDYHSHALVLTLGWKF
jgi:long-chain fatty acid transport protein